MKDWLFDVDRNLLVAVNGAGGSWGDCFWWAYTDWKMWLPVAVAVLVLLWRSCEGGWRRQICFVALFLLTIVAFDQLSSGLIKPVVARLRPSHDPAMETLLHYVHGYRGGTYGFVSGHATNIAGIALWLCLYYKDRLFRAAVILFAAGMCYSRLYLGVHFPSDVVCGALLGCAISYVVFKISARHFRISGAAPTRAVVVVLGIELLALMAYATIHTLYII